MQEIDVDLGDAINITVDGEMVDKLNCVVCRVKPLQYSYLVHS
jgi:hypothetical protein